MIAPIIVTGLLVAYFVGIGLSISTIEELSIGYRIVFIGVPLILTAVMIGVLVSRIREIKSGEEDDLSKY